MIKDAIAKLLSGKDLTRSEAYSTIEQIMKGEATPSQIAGFLVALRAKGETVPEIAGCALAMRDAALRPMIKSTRLVDTCGTGGDGQGSLNISTAAAFVAAAAGFTVAKHGNRSISSKCGSADVLEALGVRVDAPLAAVEQSLDVAGIAFLFAPNFHPAMKFAMPSRRELGVRTVFNVLGPLTNPARAQVQLIGVYDPKLISVLARVLALTGHKGGLVVHSGGMDEITLWAPTKAAEMTKGRVKLHTWTHRDFGLPKVPARVVKGGDAAENARILTEILENKPHPARPVVVANAAALIWLAARVYDRETLSLRDAARRADGLIASGRAMEKLRQMADLSHNLE